MTTREMILQRHREDSLKEVPYGIGAGLVVSVLFIPLALTLDETSVLRFWFLPAYFIPLVTAAALARFGIRYLRKRRSCPWCFGSLGTIQALRDGRANFCASCGKSLDEPFPQDAKNPKGKPWIDELC